MAIFPVKRKENVYAVLKIVKSAMKLREHFAIFAVRAFFDKLITLNASHVLLVIVNHALNLIIKTFAVNVLWVINSTLTKINVSAILLNVWFVQLQDNVLSAIHSTTFTQRQNNVQHALIISAVNNASLMIHKYVLNVKQVASLMVVLANLVVTMLASIALGGILRLMGQNVFNVNKGMHFHPINSLVWHVRAIVNNVI